MLKSLLAGSVGVGALFVLVAVAIALRASGPDRAVGLAVLVIYTLGSPVFWVGSVVVFWLGYRVAR